MTNKQAEKKAEKLWKAASDHAMAAVLNLAKADNPDAASAFLGFRDAFFDLGEIVPTDRRRAEFYSAGYKAGLRLLMAEIWRD